MRSELVQTVWARLLLGGLAGAGVRRAVISPGARSTPFTAAALATPGLESLPVADERVAGFVALGHARATGEPVLLLCTSGTAGAHSLPAVIEAAHSHVPLLVLTADRPPELHRCGASQTVDQTRLYGEFVRHFADLGPPRAGDLALRALLRHAALAVLAARGPLPGPVHLNAPAVKPLEPVPPETDDERRFAALAQELAAAGPPLCFPPARVAPPEGVEALAEFCRTARRGLLVAGPQAVRAAGWPEALWRLARATGFPVLAEATSQALLSGPPPSGVSVLSHPELVLDLPRMRRLLDPELVIQVGAAPTAASWSAALAEWPRARLAAAAEYGWNDPTGRASLVINAPLAALLAAVAGELEHRPGEDAATGWREGVAAVNAAVSAAVARELEGGAEGWGELAAVRRLVAALPPGCRLLAGNSLPVRDLDLACPAGWARLQVMSQRGASGIDGLVSGAAGTALAGQGPVAALIGDVSFLHDLGGLAAARLVRVPLVLVVLDNGGGRVFDQLPVAGSPAYTGEAARFWLTPPDLNIAAAAAAFGVAHCRVTGPEELDRAVAGALARPGCTVVEVPLDPAGVRLERERVRAAAAAAAEGLAP